MRGRIYVGKPVGRTILPEKARDFVAVKEYLKTLEEVLVKAGQIGSKRRAIRANRLTD